MVDKKHLKQKRCAPAAAVAVAAMLLTACGSQTSSTSSAGGQGGPIKLAASWSFADSVGWAGEIIGAEQKAKDLGVDLQVVSADGDPTKQSSQISTFIANGVSGTILSPVDAKGGSSLVKQVNSAGIKLATVDSHVTDGGDVVTASETDNKACGAMQAKAMLDEAKGSPLKVLMVDGLKGSTAAEDRENGFMDTLKGQPNVQIVAHAYGAWSGSDSQQAVLNAFQAHPEINAIFNTSDVNTVGTIQALRQLNKLAAAGQPGHILMTSNDGFPYGMDFVRQGYVDANASQQILKIGADAVQMLVDSINGQPVKTQQNFIPPILVTKANVDEPTLWGNKLKDWKPSDGYTLPKS